jgi:ribonuclease R
MSEPNLRDAIVELMRTGKQPDFSKSSLARALAVPPQQRSKLRHALESLAADGTITALKGARYALRARAAGSARTLTGTIKFHPKGHAFFFPILDDPANLATGIDLANNDRLFVLRPHTGTALDGDRVLCEFQRQPSRGLHNRGEMEITARVVKVLARRSNRIVGTFQKKKNFGWVECDDKALEGRIEITGDTSANSGQLVVVDLDDWTNRDAPPRGRIIEVLGWPGDPGVDMLSIIHRFGLRTSFPEDVLAAARAVPEAPEPSEIARRKDWRSQLVITIDPADAKDHDDAIWCEKRPHGGWLLAVHIADVSHYIKPGSMMDEEAVARGNSTYLIDRVLPMLPVELSNGICSLKPDVDRLTKCALLEISAHGETTKATFFDAVIHSRAKISYEQAQAILDGKPAPENSDPELVPLVLEAAKMAATMRKLRFANGALDLEMPEVKIRLDDKGRAVSADKVIHTASHQLVEECMLAANQAVASLLTARGKPAVHRIHEDPDPDRLMAYTETAKLHGYTPGDLTNRAHIQKLLDAAKGTPEEHAIKLGLLKSLKRAAYSAEGTGHYGLAMGHYTHFTSPIRRYADLIVHRALQPLLENPPSPCDRTPSQAKMHEIARHISDTERTSAEAESESRMLKLLEFLDRAAKSDDPPVYDGLVTDVRPMGVMVEVPEMGVRGVIKPQDLPEGTWYYEAHRMAFVSPGGKVVQLGMRVPLRVIGVEFDTRFVDFELAGKPTSPGTHTYPAGPIARHKPKHLQKPAPAAKSGPPRGRKSAPRKKHRRGK